MFENEFGLAPDICYLNHAAVAPWPRRTVDTVQKFAEENGVQGSRAYDRWLNTEHRLRIQLQQLINAASSEEIALLKNTSEALSTVAYGMDWSPGDEVIITSREFPSNRIVWESLKYLGVQVVCVAVEDAVEPEQALIDAITPKTRLISVSSVQYGNGFALDLSLIGNACRRFDVAFCVDAIQSLGAVPFDVQSCKADFVMADGHKWMLGPEGLALFYCRAEWMERLKLNQFGWHMVQAAGDFQRKDWEPAHSARRFECGSPNMLGVHALHASLDLLLEIGIQKVSNLISGNIQYLIDKLDEYNAEILSPRNPTRRAGIVTFRFQGEDMEHRYQYLQERGVICALRGGGIRFSPHFYTQTTIMDRALALLREPLPAGA